MPEPIPLVNGTSFFSFNTPDKELYKKTVDFYKRLGFRKSVFASRVAPPENAFVQQSLLVSTPSLSDSTVPDTSTRSNGVSIQIGLTSSSVKDQPKKLPSSDSFSDIRTVAPTFVLYTHDLESAYQLLETLSPNVFARPTELAPLEVYGTDPLGNLIGFTSKPNPFTLIPPENSGALGFKRPATTAGSSRGTPYGRKAESLRDSLRGSVAHLTSKRIAVMTSGGDSPGMNPAVRAVVRAAIANGCEAYAIFEGYEGLVRGGHLIRKMEWSDVRGWLAEGGTNIGTARSMTFKTREGRLKAAQNMIKNGIDALIVCGGDGSLTGADVFRAEWPGLVAELSSQGRIEDREANTYRHLTICGLVGSIDNDMSLTDATIGAYSSLARICQAVDYIDATAQSHSRAFVIEVMGRHCGWLALMSGIATNADFSFIPEKPLSAESWTEELCSVVRANRKMGKRKTIVIVAEGAITDDLKPITSEMVKDALVDVLGLDTRVTCLGHVQRGGTAVAYDRELATLQGVEAVNAVLESTPETPSPMIGVQNKRVVRKPLMEAVALTTSVATAIAEKDFDKAMSLRDPEFKENLENYKALSNPEDTSLLLPEGNRLKIAIINVGAPAGGMNAAVHAAAKFCFSRGHKPYAIHNGFLGLTRHESVREFNWLELEGWASRGGSELGTNRTTPVEADVGLIAYYFEKYAFDGLIIIGGFEAFVSLNELECARYSFPAFRIPMVLIPATISNNVPGTEYSLGSDTCLNALVDYCDVIKTSASASRRRVFVVEVQGANCGYISVMGGLVCGADAVYTPEEGISLPQLQADIDNLKEQFANDQGKSRAGKLILRSEKSSKVFTTEVLAHIIDWEAKGRFESRTAVPGHAQQGGIPSPMDRTQAMRLAVKAVKFIENNELSNDSRETDLTKTAVVLGELKGQLKFSPVRILYDFETEVTKRRQRQFHWKHTSEVSDMLAGRRRVDV